MSKIINFYGKGIERYRKVLFLIPLAIPAIGLLIGFSSDAESYVNAIFNSEECLDRAYSCKTFVYYLNDLIASISSSSRADRPLIFLIYTGYLFLLYYIISKLSNIYKSERFPGLNIYSSFSVIAIIPSMIFLIQPAKEIFQLACLVLILTILEYLDKGRYLLCTFSLILLAIIAKGSHQAYPAIIAATLVILISYKLLVLITRKFSLTPRLNFIPIIFIVFMIALASYPEIKEFYGLYQRMIENMDTITDAKTMYPRISNPIILGIFVSTFFMTFSPLPIINSFTSIMPIFIIETILFVASILYIGREASLIEITSQKELKFKIFLYSIIILIVTSLIVFGIGTFNWGTSLRHRVPLVTIALISSYRLYLGNRNIKSIHKI